MFMFFRANQFLNQVVGGSGTYCNSLKNSEKSA